MNRVIFLVVLLFSGGFAHADNGKIFNVCAGNESQFVDLLGGAAIGSSITASVAGESIMLLVTDGFAVIAAVPAVAPALATTAIVGSSAYIFMKGYCNSEAVADIAADLHQAAMDGAVETISIIAGTYEIAVQNTSEKMEVVAEVHKIAVEQQSYNIEKAAVKIEKSQGALTDWFCNLDPDCN